MNQETKPRNPQGRRGKEPGQPAGIVVRLPSWLNDALIEYQEEKIAESGWVGNSKEALIIHLLAQVLPRPAQKESI